MAGEVPGEEDEAGGVGLPPTGGTGGRGLRRGGGGGDLWELRRQSPHDTEEGFRWVRRF